MASTHDIDLEIAQFYAPMVLASIGYGERQINVWLPGSGKTTITKDIVTNKKLVKKTLGKIADRLIFIPISGELAPTLGLESVFKEILFNLKIDINSNDLTTQLLRISEWCQDKITREDKEIVFVINNIDDLESAILDKLLISIFNIISTNKRRILSIININNIDILEKKILINPLLFTLANRIKYIPLIDTELLKKYIKNRINIYDKSIHENNINKLINTYGGILSLLKEAIKSYPDENLIKLKATSLFANTNIENLAKFDCKDLKIFENPSVLFNQDLSTILKIKLRGKYKILFDYLEKNKKKIVSKDDIANVIWNENGDEFASDWAINQVISRFRKKIRKFGVDPEKLETINGKGYIWR